MQRAQILGFDAWDSNFSAELIQCFQTANEQGRFLTDEDLALIWGAGTAPQMVTAAIQRLRDQAQDIVSEARTAILTTFPGIAQAGGSLYPEIRSEACWRDLLQFLRCITFGIAGGYTSYTSADGLHYLQLLYQELNVPLEAMLVGLKGLKTASLKRIDSAAHSMISPYFDHLIDQLQQFEPKP